MNLTSFFHILNPNRKNKKFVQRIFKNQSPDIFSWVERTQHPTHLETIVEWALQERHTNIAVWGGDGSLNRVVQKLYELNALNKISLALNPVGTCNDFSRKVKIKEWKTLDEHQIQKIDVGLLEAGQKKRVFMNNSGFGRAKKAMKKKTSPLEDIKSFTEKKIQVEWKNDGIQQYEVFRCLFGIVFNSPYFNCRMFFDENISPLDGVLNGFMVPPQSKFSLLSRFAKSRLGMSLNSRKTARINAKSMSIDFEDEVYPQVDGEFATKSGVRTLKYSILPQKLNLFVP